MMINAPHTTKLLTVLVSLPSASSSQPYGTNVVSANFPNLATERQADLQDVNALLDRPFSKIKED
jgi:hypothetical protein